MKVDVKTCSDVTDKNMKRTWRQKILDYFERNALKILRIFLWFHRLLGLTFGGLVIDRNGKLSVNKYLKYYGYFCFILFLALDCFFYGFYSKDIITKDIENLPKMTPIFFKSIGVVLNLYKVTNLYFYNFKGFELAKIVDTLINGQVKTIANFKIIFVLISWILSTLNMVVVSAFSFNSSKIALSYSMFNCVIIFSMFWSLSSIIWVISISQSNRLEQTKECLLAFIKARSETVPRDKFRRINEWNQQLLEYKTEFIQMRDRINKLDTYLAYVMVIRAAMTIYSVMLNVYILAIITYSEELMVHIKILTMSTDSSISEMIMSCFICGLVHEKSEQIYAILDEFNANQLSDYEFKEWLMFRTSSRKTRFGFSIGGFVSLRKTTLIPIFIFVLNYTVILLQTAKGK